MINTPKITANRGKTTALRCALTCGAAVSALLIGSAAAVAQDAGVETVYVTGYRASLEKSLDIKRSTAEMVDAITAEDIGKFPDSNLAESLQRLPGVAVDRENGEGRSITVRGLNSTFTRVTLNGLQALSTAGASDSGTAPNRERQFDFNTFASELFSQLKVQKSASAATEDGSLGATVSLSTPHPLEYGEKFLFSGQNAWYEAGKPFNPRLAALVSETFLGEKVGVLFSAAYTIKHSYIDSYMRSPGQSDFDYRGSTFKAAALTGFNGAVNAPQRSGFAAPTGTSCNGTVSPYSSGVIPFNNLTSAAYCAALSGSDPTVYALINSPQGIGISDTDTTTKTSSKATAPGSLVLIPSLPTINHQELYIQRIGLTGSAQWQPDDKTLLTFDALFSTAYQDSINYQIAPIGLNRNNTNNSLNTLVAGATALTAAQKATAPWSSMFTVCTPQTGSATQADIQCYGTKQLSPIDFYTNTAYGFTNTGSSAIAAAIANIGRPATKLMAGSSVTSNGLAANKLVLDNVDFRSGADQAYYTTEFSQMSLNGTHKFTEHFRTDITVGWSHSRNHQTGLLAEVNHMDNQYANTGQYFIWDATQGGEMPSMQFGFDVANPNNWSMVKNFSALRHYEYYVDNKYRTVLADFQYDINDMFTARAGVNMRIYDFDTAYYQRGMKDVLNPVFQEAGVTTAQMTQVVNYGNGLELPSGTPTSFIVPNLKQYEAVFGFNCNCINSYGDWRVTNLYNPASTGTAGSTFTVSEHSKAYYAQMDFHDIPLFGNTLGGNAGLRFVTTEVKSLGHALQGDLLAAHNSYNDFLPAINLNYTIGDDMVLRAAASKVIARPGLQYQAPSITAQTFPSSSNGTNYQGLTMTTGNPELKPYRAKTVDIGWEWYFAKGAMISVTGFVKWVSDNPQVAVSSGNISDFLSADQISAVEKFYQANQYNADGTLNATNDYNLRYLQNNGTIAVTQARNGKGGTLEGLEFIYQQNLDFIPAVFGGAGFGLNANYTKIHSKQHYIVNATLTSTLYGDAPWLGASPDAWNLTVYYDGPNWSARVSSAFRSGYLYLYPVAGGSDVLGYGDSPLVQDFGYSKNTMNVDFSGNYDITENIELTVDALNLTNQPDRRWAYQNSPQVTKYASSGRQVFLGFRLKY